MWDPQSDPLGIGLQASARQKRFDLAAKGLAGGSSPIGPLPDPRWDAFFEAIGQKAGGREVKFGQSNAEGMDDTYTNPEKYAEQQTAQNNLGSSPMPLMGPSHQLGTLSLSLLKRQAQQKRGVD